MRRPKDHSQEVVQPDQSAQYTPNLYKESPPGYPQTASSRGMEPSPMGIESVHVHAQELPVRQVHEVQGDLVRMILYAKHVEVKLTVWQARERDS